MMIQIDRARQLVNELFNRNWQQLGHQTYDTHPYYMANNRNFSIAIAQNIRLNPGKSIQENIDNYFKRTMTRLEKYGIRRFIVFGSNSGVAIPDFFLEYCKNLNISIDYYLTDTEIETVIKSLS
jgi:hypothetical protein